MACVSFQAAKLCSSRSIGKLESSQTAVRASFRNSVTVKAQQASEAAQAPPANGSGTSQAPSDSIHVISESRWSNGIPPVMGGHLMGSGKPAPLSQSEGPGINIAPLYFHYPSGALDVDVTVYGDDKAAAAGLADLVAQASAQAIAAKGSFTIALSGGSLVKNLAAVAGCEGVDFSKWWVFWADERNVPHSSADSNLKGAQEEFLSKVPIPPEQVVAIKEGLPVEQAASHYEGRMLELADGVLPRTADSFPVLDCVLLGVGPDGHIASLFPNTKETAATKGWVLPVSNSPKPPPERITLSLPVINAAKNVAIVALGQGKADVVQRVLEVQSLPGALPAQLVRPGEGKLTWVLDQASAAQLQPPEEWASGKKFPRSEKPAA